MKLALAFDDVLLVPQYNEITSRKDVDISTRISKQLSLKMPIISSCMDTVTGINMANIMWRLGGLGIIHRYNTIEEQVDMFRQVWDSNKMPREVVMDNDQFSPANCAVAIGATGDYFDRATRLVEAGADILCVDVAHGDSKIVVEAVKKLRQSFNNITLIAGNVATGIGCARLIDSGADAIRCGIGGGSLCSTRLVAAAGKPTFQTILDCHEYLYAHHYRDFCILADGGIRASGDVVKSIAAGASAVILGQLLAATDESPGEIIIRNDEAYKTYRGMSSVSAQTAWRPETKDAIVPEGEETIIPYKGSVKRILHELVGGLRSGMTYSGARTLIELAQKAEFIQITSAGWAESKPHAKKE
jgi:IMP dehydrogenase